MTAALEFTVNADQAAVTAGEALGRAQEHAWITGGLRVVSAMALLETVLADPDRDSLTVLAIEAATENLIITIRRECGDDEADYVGGAE